jgi:hypothetical protein
MPIYLLLFIRGDKFFNGNAGLPHDIFESSNSQAWNNAAWKKSLLLRALAVKEILLQLIKFLFSSLYFPRLGR